MKKTISKCKVEAGSSRGNPSLSGQRNRTVNFCPECHAHGKHNNHTADCKSRAMVQISTLAQLPRKDASKRIWRLFIEKFVESPQRTERVRAAINMRDLKWNKRSPAEKYKESAQKKLKPASK